MSRLRRRLLRAFIEAGGDLTEPREVKRLQRELEKIGEAALWARFAENSAVFLPKLGVLNKKRCSWPNVTWFP